MWHYNTGKAFLDRLPHDGDLLVSIKEAFQKNSTKMGFFVAIGAVKNAKIAFYSQADHKYHEFHCG